MKKGHNIEKVKIVRLKKMIWRERNNDPFYTRLFKAQTQQLKSNIEILKF